MGWRLQSENHEEAISVMGEHADQGLSNHEDEQEGAAKSGDLDTEDV